MEYAVKLDESHFDYVWENLIEPMDSFMTIPREDIPDSWMFTKDYWFRFFNRFEKDYNMYGTFDGDRLVLISSVYFWSLMPYCTGGTVVTDKEYYRNKTRKTLVDQVKHNHKLLKMIDEEDERVRVYWLAGHRIPKFRSVIQPEGWSYTLEEVIEPGHTTRWRGFQLLAGTSVFPKPIYINSWSKNDTAQTCFLGRVSYVCKRTW